ncbi:hypothetical protein DdX_21815 [Ditylenchus destructor]|uniref:Uncharacterized protein n=1 Tax=Ditylenchus destructor TaxID=166010 RepID=A0AAD4MED6_9BILA|nr:hypothetical protein DdX_21815 [Ditylenchus destructor]
MERGIDGFRIDVLWQIRDRVIQLHSTDQPEAHDISAAFSELFDSYGDPVLIGEIFLPMIGTPDVRECISPSISS